MDHRKVETWFEALPVDMRDQLEALVEAYAQEDYALPPPDYQPSPAEVAQMDQDEAGGPVAKGLTAEELAVGLADVLARAKRNATLENLELQIDKPE